MGEGTMVERVARALCLMDWINDDRWQEYRDHAVAALNAMREPTSEMTSDLSFSEMMEAEETYRAMLDAALKAGSSHGA